MGSFAELDSLKKRAFLQAFAATGGVERAEKRSGVSHQCHYNWLRHDPQYVAAFRVAHEMAADMLENEAIRRAVDGVAEPVYQGRQLVGTVQRYDSTLLIFMLKGLRPEKYRDRLQIDVTGYLRDLAEVNGLDADELIREAQAIVATGRSS